MSLLGQPQALHLLHRAIAQSRIAPAYLFSGTPGIGRSLAATEFATLLLTKKTGEPASAQRIIARNHPDLYWVEPTYLHQGKRLSAAEAAEAGVKKKAPPEIRLEQIREITQFLSRPPLEATRAVIVVEAADSMAEPAANGLLKTLEEPGRATLILLAPSPESLLPTLVSRCQTIPFRRLDPTELAQVLTQTGQAEILSRPDILALAQGSPGAAIAHWQQLQTIPAELLTAIAHPPTSLRQALELAKAIATTLDTEAQLWLVDYLQHHYWHQLGNAQALHQLDSARRWLLQYVQPRLVWEVTLTGLR
jgi:DNA polymerase III subunit delta'